MHDQRRYPTDTPSIESSANPPASTSSRLPRRPFCLLTCIWCSGVCCSHCCRRCRLALHSRYIARILAGIHRNDNPMMAHKMKSSTLESCFGLGTGRGSREWPWQNVPTLRKPAAHDAHIAVPPCVVHALPVNAVPCAHRHMFSSQLTPLRW